MKIRLACAFGNEVALIDDTAFGKEIAQTDDYVIVEATRTSALPKANRHSLSLFLGTQVGATRTSASPHSKQTKSWFVMGTPI